MSKTFCPNIGTSQAVRNNGDIPFVVKPMLRKTQGVVRHKDGNSYNAGKHSMAQVPMLN